MTIMNTHHTPAMPHRLSGGERVLSVLGGSFLLYAAAGRRSGLLVTLAGGYLLYRGLSGECPVQDIAESLIRKQMNVNIRTSLKVGRPVGEVFAFWRKLENLPHFMKHLESVEVVSNKTSLWKATLPGVGTVSWHAEIVNEKANEVLGWQSVEGASVYNAGKVIFKSAGNGGTELDITISYKPPMGSVGESVARSFTPAFEQTIREDIAQFKQVMEDGVASGAISDVRNELI